MTIFPHQACAPRLLPIAIFRLSIRTTSYEYPISAARVCRHGLLGFFLKDPAEGAVDAIAGANRSQQRRLKHLGKGRLDPSTSRRLATVTMPPSVGQNGLVGQHQRPNAQSWPQQHECSEEAQLRILSPEDQNGGQNVQVIAKIVRSQVVVQALVEAAAIGAG
jgi:hypothetical protein